MNLSQPKLYMVRDFNKKIKKNHRIWLKSGEIIMEQVCIKIKNTDKLDSSHLFQVGQKAFRFLTIGKL